MADETLGDNPIDGHKFVFMGGLHRSGTTLLANILASHPSISSLTGTGVPMDEGQLIQTVFDPAYRHGGPGRFAFHSEMHVTERSPLVSAKSRDQLWNEWQPYWDLTKPILSEKSPPNLLKSRFLQAVFPESSFLMIVRHPVAVSAAVRKWSHTPDFRLMSHWAVAHRLMVADLPFLRRVHVLRYEDLITRPAECLPRLFEFLELEPPSDSPEIRGGLNDKYVNWWYGRRVRGRWVASITTDRLATDAAYFGYDLHEPLPVDDLPPYLSRFVGG